MIINNKPTGLQKTNIETKLLHRKNMQGRLEQRAYRESNEYIQNFPKLKKYAKMGEEKVYKALGQLKTSDYYGCCSDQIKALIGVNEAN